MKFITTLIFSILLSFFSAAHAGGFAQTVVAQDMVAQYVNGVLRFCPRDQVDGMLCRTPGARRGGGSWKPKDILRNGGGIQDWFSPETYVQALTGYFPQEILEVAIEPDYGIVIRFR